MRIERFLGRGDERRMISQAEIVVRAEIDHPPAIRDRDLCVLRSSDDALCFLKALRLDFLEAGPMQNSGR